MTAFRYLLRAALLPVFALLAVASPAARAEAPLNILLITVDDMGWDTPGCFGGTVEDISPNIDQLAAEGMRFDHGHVYVAVCQPSRQSMMTGKYNHNIGALGFSPIAENITTLQEVLHEAGYINGILGKVTHLKPGHKFKWSYEKLRAEMGWGRDAAQYYDDVSQFLAMAEQQGKPFFLMANSHDPHRPFHGSAEERHHFGDNLPKVKPPSRVYTADEVPVPGFLPDLPPVRKEMAQYYSSAKRADDTVGAILKAVDDAGQADNTLVMFISDNGLPIATAKWNTYLQSTKTPWIVKWPGVVEPGSVDSEHFISGVDYMPTVLEALGLEGPDDMDGRSFLPVLKGQPQQGRDHIFTAQYQWIHYYGNKEARKDILENMVNNKGWSYKDEYGGLIKNMNLRSVQNERFGYIYNEWSDGKDEYLYGYNLTAGAFRTYSQKDPAIKERFDFIRFRAPEELYDLQNDPDSLNNLIDDPEYAAQVKAMRRQLLEWMKDSGDPAAAEFESRFGSQL
jgi:N-sulfoglucosamine sulfohydrolase